jgi:hypothetical protein
LYEKGYAVRGNQHDEYAVKNERDNARIYYISTESNEIKTYSDNGLDETLIESNISASVIENAKNAFLNGRISFKVSAKQVTLLTNFDYIYIFNATPPTYVYKPGDKCDYEIYKINDNWYYAISGTDFGIFW